MTRKNYKDLDIVAMIYNLSAVYDATYHRHKAKTIRLHSFYESLHSLRGTTESSEV